VQKLRDRYLHNDAQQSLYHKAAFEQSFCATMATPSKTMLWSNAYTPAVSTEVRSLDCL